MLHVPGGQKRKSDFHTEAEWEAYKAERDAKAAARVEEWHTRERAAELAAFKEWEAEPSFWSRRAANGKTTDRKLYDRRRVNPRGASWPPWFHWRAHSQPFLMAKALEWAS